MSGRKPESYEAVVLFADLLGFKAGFLIPLGTLIDAIGEKLPRQVKDEIETLIRESAQVYSK